MNKYIEIGLMKLEKKYIWLIYFSFLLLLSFFYSDDGGEYGSIFVGINDILNSKYFGDPKYHLTAALDIANNGWIGVNNDWIFNLWPPGFAFLEAVIIKIFGENVPLILILQLIISAIFAIICTLLFYILNKRINVFFALILPLIFFIFPVFRIFLLGQFSVSFGEPFSIAFFILFILFAVQSLDQKNSIKYAVLAGLFLGLSTYFRSYFGTIQAFLSILGLVLMLYVLMINFFKNSKNIEYKVFIRNIFLIVFVSNLIMLPWRIYHLKYQNSLKWVFTGDLMIQNQLRSSDSFLNGGEWLLIGGANTACRVDKAICDKVDEDSKKLVIKTWITNPVEWYNIKFEIIDEYWFSEIKNWTKPKVYENVDFNKIFNFIVLIIIIISILYLFINKNSKTNDNLLLIWIYFSLILSYMAIFTFAHFEVRYFYFPKIIAIYILILIFVQYKKNNKNEIIKQRGDILG